MSLQGGGAVKRVGPVEKGKVEIISDNPAIPNRTVPIEAVQDRTFRVDTLREVHEAFANSKPIGSQSQTNV